MLSHWALSSHVPARLGQGWGGTQTLRGAWSPRVATLMCGRLHGRRCISQGIHFEARTGVGAAIRRGQVGGSIRMGGLFWNLGHGKQGCFVQGLEDLPVLSQTLPAAANTEVLSPQRHEGLAVLLHGLLARSPSFLVCHGVTIFPLSPNKDAPHRPNTVDVFFPSDPGSCLLCHRHKCPPSLASVAGRWVPRAVALAWGGSRQWPRSRALLTVLLTHSQHRRR